MSEDTLYILESGDELGWANRRRPVGYSSQFRATRRDENADIIRLIEAGTASCAGDPDPDRWFDNLNGGGQSIALQKRLCAHCPLRQPCREYALTNDVVGIWGGTTASERARIRQDRKITAAPVTATGWLKAER